jgi:hypothetical protein
MKKYSGVYWQSKMNNQFLQIFADSRRFWKKIIQDPATTDELFSHLTPTK